MSNLMVCAMVGAGDDVIHQEGRKQGREEGLISRFRREGMGTGGGERNDTFS